MASSTKKIDTLVRWHLTPQSRQNGGLVG